MASAIALVVLIGFFVLGLLAYRTYQAQPPIPDRVVDGQGKVLFTGEDMSRGQQVFLNNGRAGPTEDSNAPKPGELGELIAGSRMLATACPRRRPSAFPLIPAPPV